MKNTNSAILLAALCLFAFTALAQPSVGLKAGANYTGISGYNGDKQINFHAGLFVQACISDKWSFQPELLYSREGQDYRIEADETHEAISGKIQLSYASLPLMLRYHFKPGLFAEAGPQLGILVAAQSKGVGTDDMNVKRSFSNTQFAFNLGAGFAINDRIGIYGRYAFGISDIIPDTDQSNNTSVAQLGISFRLSKKRGAGEVIADK